VGRIPVLPGSPAGAREPCEGKPGNDGNPGECQGFNSAISAGVREAAGAASIAAARAVAVRYRFHHLAAAPRCNLQGCLDFGLVAIERRADEDPDRDAGGGGPEFARVVVGRRDEGTVQRSR
jgi:hypothetical protein